MSRREETVARILEERVSAILRTDETDRARAAMRAAIEGGFGVVEFTLTIPGALGLVREFAREPDLLVGAGTVLSAGDVRAAHEAGAAFVVSPVLDPAVIAAAHDLDLAAIPGASTPTEMWQAHRAGADLVKLFPAPADVPGWIAAVRGPLPMLRIFPTQGVTPDNLGAILAAGAAGAGFTKSLFVPEWLAQRNFAAIVRRAGEIALALGAWEERSPDTLGKPQS